MKTAHKQNHAHFAGTLYGVYACIEEMGQKGEQTTGANEQTDSNVNVVEAHAGAVCSDHPRATSAGLCATSDSDPARDCPAARQCYA